MSESSPIIDATEMFATAPAEKRAAPVLPRGHRRTGIVMRKGQLGFDPALAEQAAQPKVVPLKEEEEIEVKKRQAQEVARQLTMDDRVTVREDHGRCVLRCYVRGVQFEAREISWWRCLRALNAQLRKGTCPPAA